jgi:hypothetical protein
VRNAGVTKRMPPLGLGMAGIHGALRWSAVAADVVVTKLWLTIG